ncbi:hypothetical protein BJ944DRAFT_267372 [Cunninghamella echinulata]|nr:hypothetical protein BJ944DRAFT_267372 [Cunninghamella echinulata]
MEDLSNELILLIFTYLPQRQIKRCSLVNKRWYQLTQDKESYKTITIYSESQLAQFIEYVKTKQLDQKPIGSYVRHLYYYGRNLSSALFTSLHEVCPYITFMNEIDNIYSDESTSPLLSLPSWQHLNHFNSSYTYHYKNWVKQLLEKKRKVISLSFYVDMDQLETNKRKHIYLQKDTRQQKRKLSVLKMSPLTQVFRQRINTYFDIKEDHVYHYGKVLVLPQLNHLTSLCLQFSSYAMKTVYDLDERTLNSIISSCPQLESLTLMSMEMNLSNDYYNSESSYTSTVSTTLTNLAFINCNLHDPAIYHSYLSITFPKLQTFSLVINRDDIYLNNEYPSFKKALFYMITHFINLKSLTLKVNNTLSHINPSFWPIQELRQWMNHSTTILHLDILDALMDIKIKLPSLIDTERKIIDKTTFKVEEEGDDDDAKSIQYLKSLAFTIFAHTATTILSYLVSSNKSIKTTKYIASTSITTLSLETCFTNSHRHQQNIIYFYQWLDAFPNLKKFTLIGMNRFRDEYYNGSPARSIRGKHNDINREKEEEQENQHQLQQKKYKLTELKIQDSTIDLRGGLSTLCQLFPQLTILDLKNITFQNDLTSTPLPETTHTKTKGLENEYEMGNENEKDESNLVQLYNLLNINDNNNNDSDNDQASETQQQMVKYTIDATHLELDLLSLMYINYQPNGMTAIYNEMELCSFTIDELVGSTKSFHFSTIPDIAPFHLHFKCRSVEGLII